MDWNWVSFLAGVAVGAVGFWIWAVMALAAREREEEERRRRELG